MAKDTKKVEEIYSINPHELSSSYDYTNMKCNTEQAITQHSFWMIIPRQLISGDANFYRARKLVICTSCGTLRLIK